jgi:hypothetical protein
MAAAGPVPAWSEQMGQGLPGKERDDLKGSLFPLHEADSTQGRVVGAEEGQGTAPATGWPRRPTQRNGFGLGKL